MVNEMQGSLILAVLHSSPEERLARALFARKAFADGLVGQLLNSMDFSQVARLKRACPCEGRPVRCSPCDEDDWAYDALEEMIEGLNTHRMTDGPPVQAGSLWPS